MQLSLVIMQKVAVKCSRPKTDFKIFFFSSFQCYRNNSDKHFELLTLAECVDTRELVHYALTHLFRYLAGNVHVTEF